MQVHPTHTQVKVRFESSVSSKPNGTLTSRADPLVSRCMNSKYFSGIPLGLHRRYVVT